MHTPIPVRFLALLAVLALVAVACGSGEQASSEAPLVSADEPAVLPTNPDPDATPPAGAGACLEDEPECDDTLLPGEEPTDFPPPGDAAEDPVSPGGMVVDDGLTVTDALATDATGIIAVKGFLLIDAERARLCEALAESFPPQCAVASIPVTGYEEVLSAPLASSQGISWTDQSVSFLGEIVDGTFVVDPTVG